MIRCISDTLVITDPGYLKGIPEMRASTIYGDWSCMVYPGKLEEDTLHEEWAEHYLGVWDICNNPDLSKEEKDKANEEFKAFANEWKENKILGRFCADGGEVAVFIWDKLSEEDQNWVRQHPWCATVIEDFSGTVEFYDSDSETRHVIGKGSKPFFSVQSGF